MSSLPALTLVLGAARSGKSRWAEHLAAQAGRQVLYLATAAAHPDDADWQRRLERHRRRRPSHWACLEVGPDLAPALATLEANQLALVDSLGSWVAHGLALDAPAWDGACGTLVDSLQGCVGEVLMVSEQTGWGVVPATAIGGLFRDRLGTLEQRLVAMAQSCWLVVAGRAIDLLATSQRVPDAR